MTAGGFCLTCHPPRSRRIHPCAALTLGGILRLRFATRRMTASGFCLTCHPARSRWIHPCAALALGDPATSLRYAQDDGRRVLSDLSSCAKSQDPPVRSACPGGACDFASLGTG